MRARMIRLGRVVVLATAVGVGVTQLDLGAVHRSGPACPLDLVAYRAAWEVWPLGERPWDTRHPIHDGQCRPQTNYLYPTWTLSVGQLLGQVRWPLLVWGWMLAAATAAAATPVLWTRWVARPSPVLGSSPPTWGRAWAPWLGALVGVITVATQGARGVTEGNVEPLLGVLLTLGALAWSVGRDRLGTILLGLVIAIKPDHGVWALAAGVALGRLRGVVAATLGAAALVTVGELLSRSPHAWGWVHEVINRLGYREPNAPSVSALLADSTGGGPALLGAALVTLAAVWAARRTATSDPRRLLLLWLAAYLVLPRVKDYTWFTAAGPLAAAWSTVPLSAPFALVAGVLAERSATDHGLLAATVVTTIALASSIVRRPVRDEA